MKKAKVIYLGIHENQVSRLADVVLPGLTVFEKSGTFINRSFILQKFHQVVPGPVGLVPDYLLLSRILNEVSGETSNFPTLESVWREIGRLRSSCLNGVYFGEVNEQGHKLDPGKLSDFPFVESKALNFIRRKSKAPRKRHVDKTG